MASAEQVTQLIQLMQQQIQQQQTILQQRTGDAKAKRPDRPIIESDIDDREWELFLDTWSRYKTMAGLTTDDNIRLELRAACSTEVNKMLFEFVGPTTLATCTEAQLLAHIKSVAVKQVHHEVHQMNFHAMVQQENEPILHYASRLKAQAFLCKFEVKCECDPATTVCYADQMVAQRLVAGLSNMDHQRKILAEASTLVTLDDKIERLQLFETTDKSAGILHRTPSSPPSTAAPQRSQYKKDQRPPKKGNSGDAPTESDLCRGCGGEKHAGGRPTCPAFKTKCKNCKRKGHFTEVCERDASRANPATNNMENNTTPTSDRLPEVPSAASVSFSFAAQDFRQSGNQSAGT